MENSKLTDRERMLIVLLARIAGTASRNIIKTSKEDMKDALLRICERASTAIAQYPFAVQEGKDQASSDTLL